MVLLSAVSTSILKLVNGTTCLQILLMSKNVLNPLKLTVNDLHFGEVAFDKVPHNIYTNSRMPALAKCHW